MYQYGYAGTLDYPQWARKAAESEAVNNLLGAALAANKYVVGICNGVNVLSYARYNGKSILDGKNATAPEGGGPGQTVGGRHYADEQLMMRWHAETNGAKLVPPSAVGDTSTDADDVVVDGLVVTAQNQYSAQEAGKRLVQLLTNSQR